MGKRGTKPAGEINAIKEKTKAKKPISPPTSMTRSEKKLFREILVSNSIKNLDAEALALIINFCHAAENSCLANKAIRKDGICITQRRREGDVLVKHPMCDVFKESSSIMTAISTKLRGKGVAAAAPGSKRTGLMFEGE